MCYIILSFPDLICLEILILAPVLASLITIMGLGIDNNKIRFNVMFSSMDALIKKIGDGITLLSVSGSLSYA
jgi:hypothetical protein